MSEMQVVYIAGSGRSGSTLLDRLLGTATDAVSTGELRQIWARGVLQGRACGCGERVLDCPFWARTLGRVTDRDQLDALARDMVASARRIRTRDLSRPADLVESAGADRLAADVRARLIAAVRAESGNQVVVDSSKHPAGIAELAASPGVAVRVVHLVRDPRAVVNSWARRATHLGDPGQPAQARLGPVRAAALWTAWNRAVPALSTAASAPSVTVRYEDLARDPTTVVRTVWRQLDLPGDWDGVADGLPVAHTVGGNPMRFQTGAGVSEDKGWEAELGLPRRLLVQAMTVSTRSSFGYGRRPRR